MAIGWAVRFVFVGGLLIFAAPVVPIMEDVFCWHGVTVEFVPGSTQVPAAMPATVLLDRAA